MTVRELIVLLEKHDPETPILILVADYDCADILDLKGVEVGYGERYEKRPEKWFVWGQEREGCVKVLTLEGS